ncbi:MAG: EF-hand domain-containing protein [Deltaproteobacteria bacterium]|nr:EF-hand domain-containing protein [Deltaproteobacteria bacterium]
MVNQISGGGYDVTSIWQNLFNKIDQNSDGSIDKTEMGSSVSENGPSVEDIFTKLDSNQDGVIGKNEYEEALSKLRAQHPPQPPPPTNMGSDSEDMFTKIDQNGDGSISKDELSSFMGQNNQDVDKIFKEVDTDNDGVISRSESDAHLKKMQEEGKGGPPPDLAMSNANGQQDWESKMIEKLLNAYNAASNESDASKATYA